MDAQLLDLYHRHVGMRADQQRRLAEFLEREADGAPWQYKISAETLTFGPNVRFLSHAIGSRVEHDNSWLWAWCNPHLQLAEAHRALGMAIRKLGQKLGIPALCADGQFDLGQVLGDELSEFAVDVFAMIVAGEFGYDAYYKMPFAHGKAVSVLRDDRLRFVIDDPHTAIRMMSVFQDIICAMPILDQRRAFIAYAVAYGNVTEVKNQVQVVVSRENLTASFDHLNRLSELTCTLNPSVSA